MVFNNYPSTPWSQRVQITDFLLYQGNLYRKVSFLSKTCLDQNKLLLVWPFTSLGMW